MKSNGFTLLEVMIAMMIVALALGSSFGLLAGSRQLAIRAAEQIEESLFLRSMLNASQVEKEPSYPKLPEIYVKRVELDAEDELKPPARQTQKIQIQNPHKAAAHCGAPFHPWSHSDYAQPHAARAAKQ